MIALYILLPVSLGAVANRALQQGYSTVNPLRYLWIKITKGADYEGLSYLTFLLIYILVVSSGFSYFAKGEALWWVRVGYGALLFLIFLCAILNSVRVYEAPQLYKKCRFLFAPAAAGCVAVMVALSAIWADGFISVSVGVSGYELPVGLAWLGILLSPVSWAFAITVILLPWYAYVVFGLAKSEPVKDGATDMDQESSCESDFTRVRYIPAYARISCALGMAIAALAPLQLMSAVLSFPTAERVLNKSLVFASFHLQPSFCGLDVEHGKLALLPDSRGILAIRNIDKGYIFKPVLCPREWLTNEDLSALIKDNY